MSAQGQIILLHGASSSGKSTLAKALQAASPTPLLHLSIDHLRDSETLPDQALKTGRFQWADMRAQVFDGFHRALSAYASAGNNLIVEHILDTAGWLDELQSLLRPFDVLFVGIHTPLAALNARETARGDRPKGSAAEDFAYIRWA